MLKARIHEEDRIVMMTYAPSNTECIHANQKLLMMQGERDGNL